MAGSGLTVQQLDMIREYFANCEKYHPLIEALWDNMSTLSVRDRLDNLEDFLIDKLAQIELNYISVWLES